MKASPTHKDKPSIIFQSTQVSSSQKPSFRSPLGIPLSDQKKSKLTQNVPSMSSMEFKSINLKNAFGGSTSRLPSNNNAPH